MNQFAALNVSNGMDRPTPCDLAQVKNTYEQLKVRVLASPIARNASAEDEGEEPVDDDTPIVMPVTNKAPASPISKTRSSAGITARLQLSQPHLVDP